ncbi:BMP family lipoprotein [Desulfoluna spongiiphila]|uniref:Nucleoside-binding protein n=1 Tax=Desulfoluna spongiiphila TaxID=419481 RepID=A0A1G5J5S5_9BACT|nr:BMP family ABC transporter substrate-binding protein [Desulfoluna spongiiphila]SCY83179.1 nucleoside-binding protein [Desulfoluna spongiiphila]VVS93021.1 abc transporter substrate-binding protein pnra-like [Desulfoluna spongiiphila]
MKTIILLLACLLIPLGPVSGKPLTVGFLVGYSGIGDQSFNDMTYAGLIKAKQDLGIGVIVEDMEKSQAAAEEAMQRLLKRQVQVIVANGFEFKELVTAYARRHPETYFIMHDVPIKGLDNVVSTVFAVEEGAFLAGLLAASMPGARKIGYIGAVDIPVMAPFLTGFRAGIRYASPGIPLEVAYISEAPDYSGFNDPAKGHAVATEMYERGATTIFSVAGLTGNGVIQAARAADRFVIGVDSDQDHLAVGHVLTSMMKRLDIATYKEVAKIAMGRFRPGIRHYGLLEDGVGLSPMTYTRKKIPQALLDRLEEVRLKIIAGEIRFPQTGLPPKGAP